MILRKKICTKYMKEAVIDSTIEKPLTMNRLYQKVREELNAYKEAKSVKL